MTTKNIITKLVAASAVLLAIGATSACGSRTYIVRDNGVNNVPQQYDAPPTPRSRYSAASDFIGPLSPYGTWQESRRFGPVFVPHVSFTGRNFHPYTQGSWSQTEWGATWTSALPFGQITSHYGRWYRDNRFGWAWVPDNTWGPAWVSWRTGGSYIGWAPLPPGAVYGGNYVISRTSWYFVSANRYGSNNIYGNGWDSRGARYNECYNGTSRYRDSYRVRGRRYNRGPSRDYIGQRGGRVVYRPIREHQSYDPVVTGRGRGGEVGRDVQGARGGTVTPGGPTGRGRDIVTERDVQGPRGGSVVGRDVEGPNGRGRDIVTERDVRGERGGSVIGRDVDRPVGKNPPVVTKDTDFRNPRDGFTPPAVNNTERDLPGRGAVVRTPEYDPPTTKNPPATKKPPVKGEGSRNFGRDPAIPDHRPVHKDNPYENPVRNPPAKAGPERNVELPRSPTSDIRRNTKGTVRTKPDLRSAPNVRSNTRTNTTTRTRTTTTRTTKSTRSNSRSKSNAKSTRSRSSSKSKSTRSRSRSKKK